MIYSDKKRVIEKLIFKQSNSTIFVGLMGDNPIDYLQTIRNTDWFSSIILYENNPKRFKIGESKIRLWPKYQDVLLVKGDITDKLNPHYFYDFDFCTTIKDVLHYLPEIVKVKQFSLTVSTRGCSIQDTKNIFKKYLGNNNFITIQYRDWAKAPMMVIYKY